MVMGLARLWSVVGAMVVVQGPRHARMAQHALYENVGVLYVSCCKAWNAVMVAVMRAERA